MVLFFFKQKTAYEMRISDLSSDVCSSDLPVEYQLRLFQHPDRLRAAECEYEPHLPVALRHDAALARLRCRLRRLRCRRPGDGRRAPAEIGRASCRERVCQYV